MDWIPVKDMAAFWGMTTRRAQFLCAISRNIYRITSKRIHFICSPVTDILPLCIFTILLAMDNPTP